MANAREQKLDSQRLFRILLASLVVMLVVSCTCRNGCRSFQDNATSLRYSIESAAKQLETEAENAELVVSYVPVSSRNTPYTIVLIPNGPLTEDDLVRKRVSWSVARKMLKDLNYVGIREGGFIVVLQEGQTTFARYGMHVAKLKGLLAYETHAKTRIVLKKENGEVRVVGFK